MRQLNRPAPSCRFRIKSGMTDPASSTFLDSGLRQNDNIGIYYVRIDEIFIHLIDPQDRWTMLIAPAVKLIIAVVLINTIYGINC